MPGCRPAPALSHPIATGGRIYDSAAISLVLEGFRSTGLRRAGTGDIDVLHDLERQCFPPDRYGEHILSRRQFSYLVRRANSFLIVHEENAYICGYALLLFNRRNRTARLYSIAVSPALHGRGIGSALLEAVERICLRLGCTRLILEIRADNKPALQKYVRLGYKVCGGVEDYFPGHVAAIKLAVSARDVLTIRYPDEKAGE